MPTAALQSSHEITRSYLSTGFFNRIGQKLPFLSLPRMTGRGSQRVASDVIKAPGATATVGKSGGAGLRFL
ncbi:MAG: hypothetical protein JWM91_5189, partial [Rhodospirillales bacterium]|nr:hypothetical protein [Rhodospirillales bacterium]